MRKEWGGGRKTLKDAWIYLEGKGGRYHLWKGGRRYHLKGAKGWQNEIWRCHLADTGGV